METMTGWIKEKRISEDPNSQEELAYEKSDNRWRKHLLYLNHLFEKEKSIKGSIE